MTKKNLLNRARAAAEEAAAEGEVPAEGAEAAAKDGDAAKKDDKAKDGATDKKPEEKKPVEKKPAESLKLAVKRMLPDGPLGKKQLTKLKIYSGENHPHSAQNPQTIDLSKLNNKNLIRN